MALNRRGRIIVAVSTVVVVSAGVVLGLLYVGGRAGLGPLANGQPGGEVQHGSSAPSICPLTGVRPNGAVPDRPALAVKVENLPAARPQTGLSWADIIYEEPVEAGITRFIAVYQCEDASRIEPVRSARLTDPDILVQFGHPLFGYAGGVPKVVQAVREAKLIDVNYNVAASAYGRDPNRLAPHNLYTSTEDLYGAVNTAEGAPRPVFTYSPKAPSGQRVSEVHLPFSLYSDVYWKWDGSKSVWLRFHGDEPHTYSDGTQVNAKNVVVQVVRVKMSGITDVNGAPSPEVIATGSGKAYVFRGGKVITGTWRRPSLSNVTTFVDRNGKKIPLARGTAWVELVPTDVPVTFG